MKLDASQGALDSLQLGQVRELQAKRSRLGVGESVGTQFEQVLLHKVVEAMRSTIPDSGLLSSGSGGQMYDHLIAQAMSQAMAKSGGIGVGQKLDGHMGLGGSPLGIQREQGGLQMDMRMKNQLRTFLESPVQTPVSTQAAEMETPSAVPGRVDLAETLPPVEDRWLDSPQAEKILRDLLGGAQ
jgi:Rod binding domain-containing protein